MHILACLDCKHGEGRDESVMTLAMDGGQQVSTIFKVFPRVYLGVPFTHWWLGLIRP